MNTTAYFAASKTQRCIHQGPLGSYIDDFANWLREQHYSRSSGRTFVRAVANWSLWLHGRCVACGDINAKLLDRYIRYGARAGTVGQDHRRGLQKMLAWLQKTGVVPATSPLPALSQREIVRNDFEQYMLQQRGLSSVTLRLYLPYISQFLADRFGEDTIRLETLVAQDVTGFVQRRSRILGHSSVQHLVTALRAFLRYLRHTGRISINLAACVPSVANWSFSTLPKCLLPDEVERILDRCERGTSRGRRDYAILLLLARLGLRAGEVAALTLDDVDWEQGHLTVRSKGGRWTRLPIPDDVGNAISDYLKNGRPSCADRRVFIRELAPRRGFSASTCVSALVRSALIRSGIESERKGAHLFRHSLATEMLRKDLSLREIGEVLRHRSPDTTRLYAKVDLRSLEGLALPWPRGEL
jgi:site-specific recombinase XerD